MLPLATSRKQEVRGQKRLVQLDRGEAKNNNKCFNEPTNAALAVRKYNTTLVGCSNVCVFFCKRFGMSLPPDYDRW